MSAAHLYIFGWSQIKFSEVETEELRFGEQCDLGCGLTYRAIQYNLVNEDDMWKDFFN